MTFPEHLAHDPERCATCSGKRHRPDDPRPLHEAVTEYLESVAKALRQARREAP